MEQNEFKRIFKIFAIIFIIIFTASTGLLLWIEHRDHLDTVSEMKTKEEWAVQMESTLIYTHLTPLLSDVSYLHDLYGNQLANPANYDRIAQEWIIFSNKRHVYDQIRFIAANGDEKIRIDLKENGAIRVPQNELQNKKDRYYFYETTELKDNSIHISPLDLNIERNEVEIPYKPMIRFSIPLYEQNGQLAGVLVLNYLANDILNLFKRYDQTTTGHILLLNDKGYYLASAMPEQEWGFMFPGKKDVNFAVDHPDEWPEIHGGNRYLLTKDGMFTSLMIHPYSLSLQGSNNKYLPNAIYSKDTWYIVSWIPKEPANDFMYYDDVPHLLKAIATRIAFPILILLLMLIAYIGSLGIRYYQKIHYRAAYDPLTKALSRESGMIRLRSLHSSAKVSGIRFSICFMDVNGLKEINDQLGHTFGDEMIITSADIIQAEIRHQDFLIRMGGDEFLLVLPYVAHKQAEKIWDRIKTMLTTINDTEKRPYIISLSHGIVDNQENPALSLDELVDQADQKMYEEKQIIKKNFSSIRPLDRKD
jgi:diguanylate cyclase (GGDEF)-like protein